MKLGWLLFALTVTMVGARAQMPSGDQLQQALSVYQQAQDTSDREQRLAAFRQAEQLFAKVAEQGGGNADIYANQGTAALQAERLGPAIVAFRQALQRDPNHVRARLNLLHTRSLLPRWIPKPEQDIFDSFFSWDQAWSVAERTAAAGLCFLLAALLLAAAIRWRVAPLRVLAVLPGLLWLALLTSVLTDIWFADYPAAVVIVDDTVARVADSGNAPAAISQGLPEGTELEVYELRRDWARVVLSDGRSVWVPRSSLTLI